MGLVFNPLFTSGLTPTSSSGGTSISKYMRTFLTSDWILNGGNYELSIPNATHGKGVNPIVEVFEDEGSGVYSHVYAVVLNNAIGNVIIQIANDLRFNGKVLIY